MRYFNRFYPPILPRNANSLVNSFDPNVKHVLLAGSEAVLLDAAMQAAWCHNKRSPECGKTKCTPKDCHLHGVKVLRTALSVARKARGE